MGSHPRLPVVGREREDRLLSTDCGFGSDRRVIPWGRSGGGPSLFWCQVGLELMLSMGPEASFSSFSRPSPILAPWILWRIWPRIMSLRKSPLRRKRGKVMDSQAQSPNLTFSRLPPPGSGWLLEDWETRTFKDGNESTGENSPGRSELLFAISLVLESLAYQAPCLGFSERQWWWWWW